MTPLHRDVQFLAVDFFCGAGGTTRGLIDAGGYVIAGIDKDTRCKSTYTGNNANVTIDSQPPHFLEHDIFPKTRTHLDGQQALLMKELDILIPYYRSKAASVPLMFAICAPCQPFTKLSRKELSDKRKAGRKRDKNLLSEASKFVAKYKPELVLSENVSGIKDPKFGGVWDNFRAELKTLGYLTGTKVVCTSRFGIPQFRKRSILIAVRKDVALSERLADLLGSELLVPESDPSVMMVSVREAIGHMPAIAAGHAHPTIPNHRTRTLSDTNLKRLASALPGESNAYMADTKFGDLSLDCHNKVNKRLKTRCFSDVYTRMHPDRPSPTITTKCHSISNGRYGHYDTKQLRGMSLREAAILQSFPEDYVFYPTEQIESVARMIGNAVPPKLAAFYASYLSNSVVAPADRVRRRGRPVGARSRFPSRKSK
jgi:DNA (cytosine-5)-methyltransferase 1